MEGWFSFVYSDETPKMNDFQHLRNQIKKKLGAIWEQTQTNLIFVLHRIANQNNNNRIQATEVIAEYKPEKNLEKLKNAIDALKKQAQDFEGVSEKIRNEAVAEYVQLEDYLASLSSSFVTTW